ncbi:MAG: O-phosphoseryl-tRNA(Sec) selenium transferase [Candidatus Helarchaeota archaeon]
MKELKEYLRGLAPESFIKRGIIGLKASLDPIKRLFEQRRVPQQGWNEEQVRTLFKLLSALDTDKDPGAARVGEREARIISPLLSEFVAGFCHGIGRSGVLFADQPKAPGGSIMYRLTNRLALDALKRLGVPNIKTALVLPLATGMSIALILATIRQQKKGKKVIYPRADHKSPLKAIYLSGLEADIVQGEIVGDAVRVPPSRIEERITDDTVAILSTTTFFPPRESDDIKEIAKICKKHDIFHVINNAYGVQSEKTMKNIRSAIDAGRVDAFVQSTDKNFLTPVGGAIIASPDQQFIGDVNQTHAGRASAAPIIQFLASILLMGLDGYQKMRQEQLENKKILKEGLIPIAERWGERLLAIENPVSCTMTLTNFDPNKVGGALYNLRVTGPRAVLPSEWGSSIDGYPHPYLVLNAAIGSRKQDVEAVLVKLEKAFSQINY